MHSSSAMFCYVMFTLVSPSEGSFDDVAQSEAATCIVSMTAFMIFHDPFDYRLVRKQRVSTGSFSSPVNLLAAHFVFESFSFAPIGSTPHRTASPPIGWSHRRRSHPSSLPPLSPHIRWVELFATWERKCGSRNYTGLKWLLGALRVETLLECSWSGVERAITCSSLWDDGTSCHPSSCLLGKSPSNWRDLCVAALNLAITVQQCAHITNEGATKWPAWAVMAACVCL